MNILQRIFTDYYEEIKYTLHPRKTEMEISIRCWAVAILPSAELCMSAPIVAILNLSLSVVTAAFVPLVVTNMPWNALPICLLNWSMLLIATVFLPLMKISVIFPL